MVKEREQVSERLQPEPRDGRKFKFKGIKGQKDERDYNMMRRQREGRSRATLHVSRLNVSSERHSSRSLMTLR